MEDPGDWGLDKDSGFDRELYPGDEIGEDIEDYGLSEDEDIGRRISRRAQRARRKREQLKIARARAARARSRSRPKKPKSIVDQLLNWLKLK